PGSFCAGNARLFELPAWLFFTLASFATTVPILDQVVDWIAPITGIHPTSTTPHGIDAGLKLMFGGFLLTFVSGMFSKLGQQMDAAIDALPRTPAPASGMGPIMLGRLHAVLHDQNQVDCWPNAMAAITDIAKRYEGARSEMRRLFATDLEGT